LEEIADVKVLKSECQFQDPFPKIAIRLIQGNIAEEETAAKIFEAVDDLGGGIDTLVHSAGTGSPLRKQKLGDGSLFAVSNPSSEEVATLDESIDFSDYDYCQNVFPKAFTRLIERAVARCTTTSSVKDSHDCDSDGKPDDKVQKKLSVVAISSPGCNANQAVPRLASSDLRGPAKATLEMLVRYYAMRLAPRGITVNAVIPGAVFTKAWANLSGPGVDSRTIFEKASQATPMRRGAEAEEIAAAVSFLCSDNARYITGVALPVDGGLHLGGV